VEFDGERINEMAKENLDVVVFVPTFNVVDGDGVDEGYV